MSATRFNRLALKSVFSIAFAVLLTLVAPVYGQVFIPEPTVGFKATTTMDMGAMKVSGTVHYADGNSRSDTEMPMVGRRVSITRTDLGKMWLLDPKKKTYTEEELESVPGGAMLSFGDDVKLISHDKVGSDTLLGRPVTKHKIIVQKPNGTKEGGFYWIDRDNILLKYAMVFVGDDGEKMKLQYSVDSLDIGEQSDDLFELPSDYKKSRGFGVFSGIGNAAGSLFGGNDDEEEAAPSRTETSAGTPQVAERDDGEQEPQQDVADASDEEDPFADLADELVLEPAGDAAKSAAKETVYDETRDAISRGLRSLFD